MELDALLMLLAGVLGVGLAVVIGGYVARLFIRATGSRADAGDDGPQPERPKSTR